MREYQWSCLACGASNAPGLSECERCYCPARATVREMQRHRERYHENGGSVGVHVPALGPENPWEAWRVVLAVLSALLLCYIPRGLREPKHGGA